MAVRPLSDPSNHEEITVVTETRLSNETYEHLALSDPDRQWELRDGVLREKPARPAAANWLAAKLSFLLLSQLDWSAYQVRTNNGRVRLPGATYFIPDGF